MIAFLVDVANIGIPLMFLLVMLESTGIPLPGETALFAAAILASRGRLSIEEVIVFAALAAIIGDNFGYLIGRHYGRRLLTAKGPLYEHRHTALRVGEPFFERHGAKAVFFGRFFAGLRITAAWMAGITRMPWLTFLGWNALGGVIWALACGLLGYFLGHAAERIFQTVGLIGVAVFVAVVVALGIWRFRSERRKLAAMIAAAPERSETEAEPS